MGVPATVNVAFPPEHISTFAGCADTVTGAYTVKIAAEEVAAGGQVPLTTQR